LPKGRRNHPGEAPETILREKRVMIKNCIFDFDGTLVDSMQDVFDSLAFAFKTCGIRVAALSPRDIMQHQLPDAVEAAAPGIAAREKDRVIRTFIDHYDAGGLPNTRPFPGAVETLEELKRRGVPCFIVSNKRIEPIMQVLETGGLLGYFIDILTPDQYAEKRSKPEIIDHCIKKHALERSVTAYIGDMELDMVAARKCGVIAVFVPCGYAKPEEFSVKADAVIDRLDGILGLTAPSDVAGCRATSRKESDVLYPLSTGAGN
jgi:phosphoglycolate phosphatase